MAPIYARGSKTKLAEARLTLVKFEASDTVTGKQATPAGSRWTTLAFVGVVGEWSVLLGEDTIV